MGQTLAAAFKTRRDAEMAVERLVQEFGVERTDIFIAAAGRSNTAGTAPAGADNAGAEAASETRGDAPLHGSIEVSVDLADDDKAGQVRAAFAEFNASQPPAG